MTVNKQSLTQWAPLLGFLGLFGCASPEPPRATLELLDRPAPTGSSAGNAGEHSHSEESAKQAYYRYIRSAPEDDRGRNLALARLADLEFAESHRLVEQNDYQSDERYQQSLLRTVDLLTTALSEYPDAEGNDQKLYQLARSYDQLGRFEETQEALAQLARDYPSSSLYPEAQFRLAETAFSQGDYMAAEVAYTAALTTSQDTNFHERALFKRGWARYRQSLFAEALEDFVAVVHSQGFSGLHQPEERDQSVYAEYYRSLALTMIHSPSPEQLPEQFYRHGMKELFPAYRAASNLLENQGRISDAVNQWLLFLDAQPEGWPAIEARNNVVTLWRQGRFHERALNAAEKLYTAYDAQAESLDSESYPETATALETLRQHWKEAAQQHHAEYQENADPNAFAQAQSWYQRYLNYFDGYAQQDGIALAYGDLLSETSDTEAAFVQYERAAFDGSLIRNPEAAYAAIALLSELTDAEPEPWLDRYIKYTRAFVQLYPQDERSPTMALSAAQKAFHQRRYDDAASMVNLALPQAGPTVRIDAQQLLAQSFLQAGEYEAAEQASKALLALPGLSGDTRNRGEELQALGIYRQAEAAEQQEAWDEAIGHYRRIHELLPHAENAVGGLYNALALAAEREQWPEAITLMERFQQQYPDSNYLADVERRLTQAYLATGQTEHAARQYEQLAQSEQDVSAQRAALWNAAELYDEQDDIEGAINAYRRYAHSYPDPYPQNAEAMHKLIGFYQATGEADNRQFWERRLLQADRNQPSEQQTDRTSLLAAQAALSLGQAYFDQFERTRLSLPLDQSLARKTEHMQNAIQHFATTASYGFAELSSEATHRIGRIYETLAQDLLDSDRPPELNEEERMQYDILLEDRAFPFEDRAIEFYERNLTRAQQEGFNEWMVLSRSRLETLFPVRYSRKPKAGLYVAEADQITGAQAEMRRVDNEH